jgi:hypothetical protein
MQFIGEMYGLKGNTAHQRSEQLLKELDLTEKKDKIARTLSGGMQRRLNLVMALVHDPEILVLDEPEAGLDPQSRVLVREYVKSLGPGFHSQGPVWVAILVSVVASLSVIGLGMVVASLARSVSQAFVVANFPLGLMMFFSGVIFPMPAVKLFTIAGHAISPYDILPPTHAVVALNKILTLGASLGDVAYELTALLVLSVLYFIAGAWLFKRMHLCSA